MVDRVLAHEDDRAAELARRVRQKRLSWLAPLIEPLAARLDRRARAPGGGVILRAEPRNASLLRPAFAKILAFDDPLRSYLILAQLGVLFGVACGFGGALSDPKVLHRPGAPTDVLSIGVGLVGALLGGWLARWALLGAMARLRELGQVLPRCIPVSGRVTSAAPYRKSHTTETRWVTLTVEYFHAGARHEVIMKYAQKDGDLVDPAPPLLVDPEETSRVFLRDFYV